MTAPGQNAAILLAPQRKVQWRAVLIRRIHITRPQVARSQNAPVTPHCVQPPFNRAALTLPHELPDGGGQPRRIILITNKTIAAAAAILVSVLSGVAVAQTAAPTAAAPEAAKPVDPAAAKFRAVCKSDIDKLCSAEIAAAKAAAPAVTDPAAKGQARGDGRGAMGACMTANEAKLSAECQTAWTERKAAWAAKKS